MATNTNEYAILQQILTDLRAVVQREGRRHMMDCHLNPSTHDLIAYEIIPALEDDLNWEPSDADLTGEPPLTSAEIHHQAWTNHVALHS